MAVEISLTAHKLTIKLFAPVWRNACLKPCTDSPNLTSPKPDSQADNTTNLVALKSQNVATAWAVRMPSSAAAGSLPPFNAVFAPAKANPALKRGF